MPRVRQEGLDLDGNDIRAPAETRPIVDGVLASHLQAAQPGPGASTARALVGNSRARPTDLLAANSRMDARFGPSQARKNALIKLAAARSGLVSAAVL